MEPSSEEDTIEIEEIVGLRSKILGKKFNYNIFCENLEKYIERTTKKKGSNIVCIVHKWKDSVDHFKANNKLKALEENDKTDEIEIEVQKERMQMYVGQEAKMPRAVTSF